MSKYITYEDLESKIESIKADFKTFTEREQDIRHAQNNKIQTFLMSDKECTKETEIALLQQEDKHMLEKMDNLYNFVVDHMNKEDKDRVKLIKSIEWINTKLTMFIKHETYKEDKEEIKADIDKLKEDSQQFKLTMAKWWGVWMTISVVAWFIIDKLF